MGPLNKIILFAVITALFVTCKKEEAPSNSTIGQPVFSFNGTIGGNAINLKAGVNNYYMYSSFIQDSVGYDTVVYGFTGNLQSTSTTKNSIQITINDYKISVKNASVSNHIDSAFSQTAYFYNKPGSDTIGYLVKFTPLIYSGSVSAFTYSFGDGTPNNITTNTTPVTHTYTATAVYTTSVTAYFSSCAPVTVSNPVTIAKGAPRIIIDSINSSLGTDSVNSFPVTFTATISNGTSPFIYSWNFGDGNSTSYSVSSLTSTVTHTYTSASTFPVNLTVTDHLGNSASYNKNVTDSLSANCRFDYSMSTPVLITRNSYPLSEIVITYTDQAGNVYTSENPSQPVSSIFTISSVSDYKNNINNELTKVLTVEFNCMLYNITTGSPVSASGTVVIAVAYQ